MTMLFYFGSDASFSLPPRSGGEGRPLKAVGVGGAATMQSAPTPDPSPPRASRVGGGETALPRVGA
jgi:hypothetical protein